MESLHISVKKGEKAIKVLVPIPYHKEIVNVNADNPEDKEIVKIDKLYFKLGNVFDIGQTDGELPSLSNELLDNPEELTKAIPILMRCNSIPTEFEESLKGDSANGYYHVVDNKIAIKPDMPSAQTLDNPYTVRGANRERLLSAGRNVEYNRVAALYVSITVSQHFRSNTTVNHYISK